MDPISKRATMLGTREIRGGLTANADAPAGVIGADWSPLVSLRADQDADVWRFAGEAAVVENPYTVYDMFGDFTETIAEGAFTKTLGEDPLVSFVSMHSLATVMAQTRGRGLTLSASPNLSVDAELAKDDADVARIAPKIRRGLMNSMSFAFRVTRQEWDEDYVNRRILEVNLQGGDVSVITTGHGANPAAHGDLRSLDRDDVLAWLIDLDAEARDRLITDTGWLGIRSDDDAEPQIVEADPIPVDFRDLQDRAALALLDA